MVPPKATIPEPPPLGPLDRETTIVSADTLPAPPIGPPLAAPPPPPTRDLPPLGGAAPPGPPPPRPPGGSGPFPPPYPGGPGQPVRKKSNGMIIAAVALVLLAVVGLVITLNADKDDDKAGPGPKPKPGPSPTVTFGDDGPDPTSEPTTEPTTETTEATTTTLQPAQANVHDCIAVDSSGTFQGTGSCSNGGTPYTVYQVVERGGSCSNPDSAWIGSGDYQLCLEVNVIRNYCYVFPQGANGGLDGWITVASACKAPGTVHVIDIVPGAANGDSCTNAYKWNYWYGINAPKEVVCVMKY